MNKYSIGVDFGTQSGRAVIVELGTGRELASSVKVYTHGVMDKKLPDGKKLMPDWALQHPADYIEVLEKTIPSVLEESGISNEEVIGMSIDFTACTMLPVDNKGNALCLLDKYKDNPHAYVKLWKHHAAQDEANKINDIGNDRSENFLKRYGGKISSEWMFPKIWQILNEAPDIYDAADRFMEAADWVIMQITGNERRNSCTAGYKAMYSKTEGYPSKDFFKALDPRLENVIEEKMSIDIYPLGSKAGEVTEIMAELTGLKKGTAVAVANVDAHVTVPVVGITKPGKMLMIMGTSTCHMVCGSKEKIVPGTCGMVHDGILPGYIGFEAGQSCVGDHFEWFVNNCVPEDYTKKAKELGLNIHDYLTELASKLNVGQSGLIALDWWNGNRSVLVDADLTGLVLGCTLHTKPEEIYRALIEATAFGTRMIIDNFTKYGVEVDEIYAAGGIAQKNELLMQIYSDVTNRKIKIGASSQAAAVGSAMFGAVAAGKDRGGYDTIFEAADKMGKVLDKVYMPNKENVKIYDELYKEYEILHDYFGRGENNAMKRLKEIKIKQSI